MLSICGFQCYSVQQTMNLFVVYRILGKKCTKASPVITFAHLHVLYTCRFAGCCALEMALNSFPRSIRLCKVYSFQSAQDAVHLRCLQPPLGHSVPFLLALRKLVFEEKLRGGRRYLNPQLISHFSAFMIDQ